MELDESMNLDMFSYRSTASVCSTDRRVTGQKVRFGFFSFRENEEEENFFLTTLVAWNEFFFGLLLVDASADIDAMQKRRSIDNETIEQRNFNWPFNVRRTVTVNEPSFIFTFHFRVRFEIFFSALLNLIGRRERAMKDFSVIVFARANSV